MKKKLKLILTSVTLCSSYAITTQAGQETKITSEVLAKLSPSACRAQVLSEIVKGIDKNTRLTQHSAAACSLGDKKCLLLQAWLLGEEINKNLKLGNAKIYEGYTNKSFDKCKDDDCRNLQVFNSLKHAYFLAFGSIKQPVNMNANTADSAIQMAIKLYYEVSLTSNRTDFNALVKSCR